VGLDETGRVLSAREREVALLVAEGLTNRQVAERLAISERTVDGSLLAILRKLDIDDRGQIAASLMRRQPAAASSRLPAVLSSFVGREEETAHLGRLVAARRLVTLVGPGGVGKTRLGLEVARLLEPRFAGGARFAPLSGVSDGQVVGESILASLGLPADPPRSPRESIARHFGGEHVLLVLDNCEHVIDASAAVVDDLLARCPRLHVLATSREPLMLRGERVHQVAPLDLPAAGQALEEDGLRRHSALRLFLERCEEASGTAIRAREAETIAQICRRLDGLPLALELAAARIRAMSPDALLAQLTDRDPFRVLTAGVRTAEDRHRTLRATVEWSYRLLNGRERLVFARLSVFAGAFDLPAAENVAGEAPIGRLEVPDLLSGLVDKSLVHVVAGKGTCPYQMLDTLRAFGRERLVEAGDYEATERRHAHHYADLLAQPALTWTRATLDEMRDQLDDIRAALGWSCAHEPALATLICGRLVGFWGRHGHLGEGCLWMDRIIDRLPEDDFHRAVAYANAAWLAQRHGDFDVAERHATEELRIARLIGDVPAVADALTRLGDIARNRGDQQTAVRRGEEGVAMRREEGDPYELALALMVLGSALGRGGASDAGRAHLEEAAGLFESIRERSGVALSHGWLGELELRAGDLQRARQHLTASLRDFRDLQDAWMVANLLDLLCWLAGVENEPLRVLRLAGAATRVRERVGASQLPVLAAPLASVTAQARRWLRSGAEPAWRQGADSDAGQALAYALRDVEWEMPEKASQRSRILPGGLTQREFQVAVLVAQGFADKEIGVRLGISVRTAEYHVDQIRRKLGCTSRTQITRWALERDLVPPGQ
jgi:predicted ATPase/DNA-binding NarL/FixJ family response regulator